MRFLMATLGHHSVEIKNPHCRSFLLSVWYRPPNSEISLCNGHELFLLKYDDEDKKFILLCDLNCDVNESPVDAKKKQQH